MRSPRGIQRHFQYLCKKKIIVRKSDVKLRMSNKAIVKLKKIIPKDKLDLVGYNFSSLRTNA